MKVTPDKSPSVYCRKASPYSFECPGAHWRTHPALIDFGYSLWMCEHPPL